MGSVYFVCSRVFVEWLWEVDSSGNPSSKYARRKVVTPGFCFAVLGKQCQRLSLHNCAFLSVEISSSDYKLVFVMGEVCIQDREVGRGIWKWMKEQFSCCSSFLLLRLEDAFRFSFQECCQITSTMSIHSWHVAGAKVESECLGFHSGEKRRGAGPVSWYRWVIEKRIGEAADPTSQLMQTRDICMQAA